MDNYLDLHNKLIAFGKEPSFQFDIGTVASGDMKNFFNYCRKNSEHHENMISAMIDHLLEFDIYKACVLSLFVGIEVENGYESEKLDILLTFCNKITDLCLNFMVSFAKHTDMDLSDIDPLVEAMQNYSEEELFNISPDGFRALAGSECMIQSVMTTICRSRERRDFLRNHRHFGERATFYYLSSVKEDFDFLVRALEMCEDEKLIIIDPKTKSGCECVVKQIENNFSLFSLIQLHLYKAGFFDEIGVSYNYNQDIDQIAHNNYNGEQPSVDHDEASLQYYTFRAYQADGSYRIIEDGELIHSSLVWGGETIGVIPKLSGVPVILIDKDTIFKSRTWGLSFLVSVHPAVRPDFEIIRKLDSSEVEDWIQKIVAENHQESTIKDPKVIN